MRLNWCVIENQNSCQETFTLTFDKYLLLLIRVCFIQKKIPFYLMGVLSCCRATAYFLKYFGKAIDKRNSITDAYSYKYEFQLYIP